MARKASKTQNQTKGLLPNKLLTVSLKTSISIIAASNSLKEYRFSRNALLVYL